MRVRILDLTDRELDRVVSKARGETPIVEDHQQIRERLRLIQGPMGPIVQEELAKGAPLHVYDGNRALVPLAEYCTNWADGGPIVEACRISIRPDGDGSGWRAWRLGPGGARIIAEGPTALIAAMRCFAIGELGESVEL